MATILEAASSISSSSQNHPEKAFEAAEDLRRSKLPTYAPVIAYRELLVEEYIVF